MVSRDVILNVIIIFDGLAVILTKIVLSRAKTLHITGCFPKYGAPREIIDLFVETIDVVPEFSHIFAEIIDVF